MHYKQLLDIVSKSDISEAYEKAMQDLEWHSSKFNIGKAIPIFEGFLIAWRSLRRPLDKGRMTSIWKKDVELYVTALENELLENLDTDKVVEAKNEELRIGLVIEHMYGALSTVPGVGNTNTAKLLHLRLPNLFVMTDKDIRKMFKDFRGETFSPYSYTFNFLLFVKSDVNEAIDTLCTEKRLTRQQGMDYLRKAHGRERSLAKLMDECYWLLAHQAKQFPSKYYYPLMATYK